MSLPHPRFTLRGMIVAVAILGIPLGTIARANRLQSIAVFHHAEYQKHMVRAGDGPFRCGFARVPLPREWEAEMLDRWYRRRGSVRYHAYRQAAHHFDLSDKYARAARYPWLPVAPDPPDPE